MEAVPEDFLVNYSQLGQNWPSLCEKERKSLRTIIVSVLCFWTEIDSNLLSTEALVPCPRLAPSQTLGMGKTEREEEEHDL